MIYVKARGVVIHEGNILLCELKKHGFWCLPGGTVEGGELPRETLVREFEEELGVVPEVGELIYLNQFTHEDDTCIDMRYMIENSVAYVDLDRQSASHAFEHTDVKFVDMESFEGEVQPMFMKQFLRRLGEGNLSVDEVFE